MKATALGSIYTVGHKNVPLFWTITPTFVMDFNTLCTNKYRKKCSIGVTKFATLPQLCLYTTWENLKHKKTAWPWATTSCLTFDRTSCVQPLQKVV